jgi:hypothetical protein
MDDDQSNDQTGEYGASVDRDTGANVGDTGSPELDETQTQQEVQDASPADGVDAGDVPGRASIPGATEGVDPDDVELRLPHD